MATRKSSRLASKVKRSTKESFTSSEDRHAEIQCAICLGGIKFRGKLSVCRHQFCYTCIFEWAKNTNTCPLCKKRFRCITRVCVAGTTPPRQVRVPDRDGYHDDSYGDVAIDDIRGTMMEYISHNVLHLQSSRAADDYDYGDSFIDDSQLTSPNISAATGHWSSIPHSTSPHVHDNGGPRWADSSPSTIHSLQSPSPCLHSNRMTRRSRRNSATSRWDDELQSPSPCAQRTRRDSHTCSVVVQSPSLCLHERTRKAHLLEYSDSEELPQSHSTPSDGQSVDDYSVIVIPDTPKHKRVASPLKSRGITSSSKRSRNKTPWMSTRIKKQQRRVGRQLQFY